MNRNAVNRDDPEILLKSGWLSPTANIFACYCRENWNKTIKDKKKKKKNVLTIYTEAGVQYIQHMIRPVFRCLPN